MGRSTRRLEISNEHRQELKALTKRKTAPQRMVRRAQMIIARADGASQEQAAQMVGVRRTVVTHWEKRFRLAGMEGLHEAKRSGRKPSLDTKVKEEILTEATRPPKPRKRWSLRSMARAKKVSPSTVHKIWKANEIKPHLSRTFKVSNDKQFEEKFWDVIGLYLNPPDRALVLCCDEKSQCQALERTQPGLPLGVGEVRTKTHDYKRHGTITLFAALDYLEGTIFRKMAARHTHREWLDFLKQIDREAPEELTLHLIIDNYATHKHSKVRSWIKWRNQRHNKQHGAPRIELHFTPTSCSWLNMIERFFRDLSEDVIREGSFAHVKDLIRDIEAYLAERDLNPKRYVWKAKGEEILAKLHRARQKMEEQNNV